MTDNNPPKHKSKMWLKIVLIIIGILIAISGTIVTKGYMQKRAIANLEKTGSPEYKQYLASVDKIEEQWLSIEAEMKAKGSNTQEMALAKRDYINFIGSTLFLKIKSESSLSDIEKKAIFKKLLHLAIKSESALTKDSGCEYTEQELALQDFFVGATIKFKKPMIYVDWKEEKKKECSPILSSAKYFLFSREAWGNIVFDKTGIVEHPIDPSTTFTVEKRILVKRGGLFSKEMQHYVLRDNNGVISVPPFYIFDSDFDGKMGESGSELYQGNRHIGHIVSDIRSGGVWIQGTKVPKEIVEANTPKRPTSFESVTAKRGEFIERVMFAVDEGKLVDYSNQELIANDLAKDVYTYKEGEVIHNFGGKVYVKKNGDYVSIIFENIPSGEECYEFYFINDPAINGFKESYIDGVLEKNNASSSEIEEFKQKVCYSGKKTVTIEFRGNINDIKEQAAFFRRINTPKY